MADTIIIRDPSTGQKYEAPAGTPIPEGFEPIESKGPLRSAIDAISGSYREKAAGAAEGVSDVLGMLGLGGRESLPNRIGTAVIAPPPTLTGQAVSATQGLPLGLAGRLAAPTAAGAIVGGIEEGTPMGAARGGAVGLSSTMLGEGLTGGLNFGRSTYANRDTNAKAALDNAREMGGLSRAATEVLPQAGPLVRGGTYIEMSAMQDKVAGIKAAIGAQKDLVEQEIRNAFGNAPINGAGDTIGSFMDKVKALNADARLARQGKQPLSGKGDQVIPEAAQADAYLRQQLGSHDPRLLAAYEKSVRDTDLAYRLDEIAGAATSRGPNVSPAETVRDLLEKKRGKYPTQDYQPVYDAAQFGQDSVKRSYEVPWFIRSVLPVPPTVGTLRRPGAPQPQEIPPNILSTILGKALNSFTPGR